MVSVIAAPASCPKATLTASSIPTEWVASGHHSCMRAVNSSKARCGAAETVTDFRTGSTEVTWLGIGDLLLVANQRVQGSFVSPHEP
jgi:hypothetical protein